MRRCLRWWRAEPGLALSGIAEGCDRAGADSAVLQLGQCSASASSRAALMLQVCGQFFEQQGGDGSLLTSMEQ